MRERGRERQRQRQTERKGKAERKRDSYTERFIIRWSKKLF